ncbi:MAG: hypothetical protein BK997_01100 [Candidatus Micrarchaeum sp. ARMAN-1]|nr:MAG: hypothetical protein BK997_01100 [Candidatus Micrarchaeum sp. ARMAN-1]
MSYDILICNWHKKAAKQKDFFSSFVFEYLAFIAHIRTQLFNGYEGDRECIQKLKQDNSLRAKFNEAIKSDKKLEATINEIIEKLNSVPLNNISQSQPKNWWNCSDNNPCGSLKMRGIIKSSDDWENIIEFWYTVRNNLFHGGKDPEAERDKFMVEHGYKTLRALVKIMLKDCQQVKRPSGL